MIGGLPRPVRKGLPSVRVVRQIGEAKPRHDLKASDAERQSLSAPDAAKPRLNSYAAR